MPASNARVPTVPTPPSMKTIPRLLCLLVLLSASGIVSGIDRVTTHRLNFTARPDSPSKARATAKSIFTGTTAGVGWRCVTPAPIGPAATAGRAGHAFPCGF